MRTRYANAILSLCFVLCSVSGASAQVRWRSGTAPLSGKTRAQVADTLSSSGLRGGERHFVVQFSEPMTDARRAQLAAAGVELLGYLSDNAFFASVAPQGANAAAVAQIPTLIDAQPIERDWKLHPTLAARENPTWANIPAPASAGPQPPDAVWIGAYVLFHPDIPARDAWNVATAHGAVVRQQLFSVNGAVIELPLSAVDALAADDAVQYLEPALPPIGDINDSNRALTQAATVQLAPYNLTGSGVTVMVYDGGTGRSTHVDFQGRLFVRDSSGQAQHSTHVAGTIGGAGIGNVIYKGMAPGVILQSYGLQTDGSGIFLYTNPGDLETDYNQAINTYGSVISNNSIGTNTAPNGFNCSLEGDYGVTDTVIDAIVRGSLGAPFRVVWANGNERQVTRCGTTYHTTAPPACAKNHITVGAVNSNNDSITSFTSWGPADDGRLKPDISGPGCQSGGDGGVTSCNNSSNTSYVAMCGTSMAAPTITGCSALLMEDFKNQFPGQDLFRNSTLKAWLAHSAQDRGNVGPDFQFGYGSVRIQAAIDLMRSGAFTENTVSQGTIYSRTIIVDAGDPEFKVTLAWDDVPGTPNVSPALVNDLDLRVLDPNGVQVFPWTLGGIANPSAAAVRTQANHLDNIEQVQVSNPAAGTWTVEVVGFNVPQGPQPFSLVGDGASNVGISISVMGGPPQIIAPGTATQVDVQILAIGETIVPGSPTLHYRFDGGAFQTAPLTFVSGNIYRAFLPTAECGDNPEYYFTAAGTITGTVQTPGNAPTSLFTAIVGTYVPFFEDDMETDKGWTVGDTGDNATTGVWTRNVPQGTTAQPENDHTGPPGVNCWVTDYRAGTGLGDFDVDLGKTTLKSPTIDLSAGGIPIVGYWRWYSNNQGGGANADVFTVDVSNDNGNSWVTAETVGPTGLQTAGGWFYHEFTVSDFVAPTAQVKLRFVASDLNTGSLIEAALDDVIVIRLQCTPSGSCSDGIQNQGETRIDCGGPCAPCACTEDSACSNNVYCDGAETCDALGQCQSGTPVICNDSIACTHDSCDEDADACAFAPSNGFCDNGQYCDGVETCSPAAGCQPGTLVTCDDAVACTTDTCNESTDSCEHALNDAACDNGVFCDGVETCSATVGCEPGEFPCTSGEWCDEAQFACTAHGNGDFNNDGRVDLGDFARFQDCYGQPMLTGCEPANLLGSDGAVDSADFDEFANVLTGP